MFRVWPKLSCLVRAQPHAASYQESSATEGFAFILTRGNSGSDNLFSHLYLERVVAPGPVFLAPMSLFGDDDDLPSRPKQSSALFDENPKPALRSSNSLFADDLHGDDSPWGMPTPKKGGRGSLVKSLLPASDVPDSYIDAYDALLEAGLRAGSGVSLDGVRKLLAESGIASDVQSNIVDIVKQPGQEEQGLGRGEFNVLFALIGACAGRRRTTLDSVDERRKSKWAIDYWPCAVPVN